MSPEVLHSLLPIALGTVIVAPAAMFLMFGALWLLGAPISEKLLGRSVVRTMEVSALAAMTATFCMVVLRQHTYTMSLGTWFSLHDHAFELPLYIDALALTMIILSTLVLTLIARFAVVYMHKEPGFLRFFMLTLLFATGLLLLDESGSIDLLFVGWELVGISSVLLIAFFRERTGPLRQGIWVLSVYRVCDVGLIAAAVLLHHFAHNAEWERAFGPGEWPLWTAHLEPGVATLIALCLLFAAMGKSAQFPFTGWLPRAMEGPTPSSALFYGALSVHAGVFLLMRAAPLLAESMTARLAIATVGLLTAITATLSGRTQSDAKNALAYATVTQVGIMFVEIALGLYVFVLIHLVSNVILRTFQFLRAGSGLQEAQARVSALGEKMGEEKKSLESLLPLAVERGLYDMASQNFYIDEVLRRWIAHPLLALARLLDRSERGLQETLLEPSRESEAVVPAATLGKANGTR